MAEIKTDKNSSEVSNQDPTDDISSVIYYARDVEKSRRSISDPTATT